MSTSADNPALPFSTTVSQIVACAKEVHRVLGPGLGEANYRRALGRELQEAGLPFTAGAALPVRYKGDPVGQKRVAFLVAGVVVEVRARPALDSADQSQIVNTLKAAGLPIALLLNFGAAKLEVKRLVSGRLG
jgi:GxxExxY protein